MILRRSEAGFWCWALSGRVLRINFDQFKGEKVGGCG